MSRFGLKAKDYSDFSKVQTIADSNAGSEESRRSRIASSLHATEVQLQAADSIISNPSTVSKASKVTKQVMNTLLAPAKSLAELLGLVSEMIPPTEPVAELFKGLLKLELDRQENDKQIAALYHSMSSMLVVLARIDNVFSEESELSEQLDHKLDEIVSILNDFGNFCDVFYKHRTVVRFLRSSKYIDMLQDFAENFASTKRELEAIIMQHTTLTVIKTSTVVNDIAREVSQISKFMSTQTTREREAQNIIKAKGGVETDEKLLSEVAEKLGDSINSSAQANRALQYSLHADLSGQIQENQSLFILKLQCVKDEIEESVNRSTKTILTKLDEGPHELINDPDIKAVWKDMCYSSLEGADNMLTPDGKKWRNTVKSRHFVSAVHHHFEESFIQYSIERKGEAHPDLWTLNYLSRVIFYPAIADAIDEDTSGYVSLHELNHFFDSRPKDWTLPQWLAYWAAGWYQDNLRYRDKIMTRLAVFENSIDGLHAENKEPLRSYLNAISTDIKLIAGSLYNNVLDYFEDDSTETLELESLRDKYTELVTKEIEERLEKSKYALDDRRTLGMVVGAGNRLESRILCVIHRLLKRHHKMFDIGKENPLQGGVTISMTASFQVVFEAFTKRTRSLAESWRQQRMDASLQAEWYANGLFEDWYKRDNEASDEEEYDEDDLSEEDEESEEEHEELEEYVTRPPTEAGSVQGDLEQTDSVEGLDERNDTQDQQVDKNDDNEDGDDVDEENDDNHHGQNTSQRNINHEREVDGRLDRLEERMDELKDLMLRILARLEE